MLLRKIVVFGLILTGIAFGQDRQLSGPAKAVSGKMSTLRAMPAMERAAATLELALAIRALPSVGEKLSLAASLANLSTEGDNGREALQAVADTLAQAIGQAQDNPGMAEAAYAALARVAHYEDVTVRLDDPPYTAALERLEQIDRQRQTASVSLKDLTGKQWSLDDLRGKVVLVNFWATWCPPCRKEMPDLDALYKRFQDRGLVVLAISDEEEGIVRKFLGEYPYSFPILLDPGGVVKKAYLVDGIPNSFVYSRDGELVATGEDQRTERQFLEMLGKAGLR